jgi:hypothetical protein
MVWSEDWFPYQAAKNKNKKNKNKRSGRNKKTRRGTKSKRQKMAKEENSADEGGKQTIKSSECREEVSEDDGVFKNETALVLRLTKKAKTAEE